jgi:putative ATPase
MARSKGRGDDLFDHAWRERASGAAPLAARMRPRTLDEVVGQAHLLGPGHLLQSAVASGQLPSMVLWGPPGVGKTTLASLLAGMVGAHFIAVSAVTSGVADLRAAVEEAKRVRLEADRPTVLFVDEVHRFNKAQQDAILPHVESGAITFVGATTENPSFEVIAALLSRSRVLTLKPLTDDELTRIIERALSDTERGLGGQGVRLEPDALAFLLDVAAGDARVALNAVELAAQVAPEAPGGSSAGPPSTTRAAMRTTRPSRRSSSRCAPRTRTRPSTGWRVCWRRARTRCSSPGAW